MQTTRFLNNRPPVVCTLRSPHAKPNPENGTHSPLHAPIAPLNSFCSRVTNRPRPPLHVMCTNRQLLKGIAPVGSLTLSASAAHSALNSLNTVSRTRKHGRIMQLNARFGWRPKLALWGIWEIYGSRLKGWELGGVLLWMLPAFGFVLRNGKEWRRVQCGPRSGLINSFTSGTVISTSMRKNYSLHCLESAGFIVTGMWLDYMLRVHIGFFIAAVCMELHVITLEDVLFLYQVILVTDYVL